MGTFRIIARLDVKGKNIVKGINLEGLRKIGDPNVYAKRYYAEGIDEILYMDVVASLYERGNLLDIVRETTRDVFIPITVGGGIRTLEDVSAALRAGGDKIALNTAVLKNPRLITDIANAYGAQCVVLSVEAKKCTEGRWLAYYDNGREKTEVDVLEWVQQGYALGAGEILLTSVDREGMAKGFDLELVKAVCAAVPIPVIACGGMGSLEHLTELVHTAKPDAVAVAHVLHYDKLAVPVMREHLRQCGVPVRTVPSCL